MRKCAQVFYITCMKLKKNVKAGMYSKTPVNFSLGEWLF